jgi:hypothetical protein
LNTFDSLWHYAEQIVAREPNQVVARRQLALNLVDCGRVNSTVVRLLLRVERKSFLMQLIETWVPPIGLGFAFGAFFSMLSFLLRFTPFFPIAQILAWPGYLVNAISPIDDTPANVQERILDVGVALVLPVYGIIFVVAWFWFIRAWILKRATHRADDV